MGLKVPYASSSLHLLIYIEFSFSFFLQEVTYYAFTWFLISRAAVCVKLLQCYIKVFNISCSSCQLTMIHFSFYFADYAGKRMPRNRGRGRQEYDAGVWEKGCWNCPENWRPQKDGSTERTRSSESSSRKRTVKRVGQFKRSLFINVIFTSAIERASVIVRYEFRNFNNWPCFKVISCSICTLFYPFWYILPSVVAFSVYSYID